MFHWQVVSFDWYLPYFSIKTQNIYTFYDWSPVLVYSNPPSFFSLKIRFVLFNTDGALIVTNSLAVSRLVAQLATSTFLFYEKTKISLWRDTFRLLNIFLNVILKLSLFTCVWSCFISNNIFLCVSKLPFCQLCGFMQIRKNPYLTSTISLPGPRFNIKMTSHQYRESHCGDKTILRPSYLHNGISYTGKTASLYWIGTQDPTSHSLVAGRLARNTQTATGDDACKSLLRSLPYIVQNGELKYGNLDFWTLI